MMQRRNRITTVLAVLLGVAMIGSGATKLAGQSTQVAAFAAFGLPGWFRALVGTFEVVGGVLVIVPATTPAGTLILSTILVGALWAHASQAEWLRTIPVVVLLAMFLSIFRVNRDRALALLERM